MLLDKSTHLHKQIMQTLKYCESFQYPLTKQEIWERLIVNDRFRSLDKKEDDVFKIIKDLVKKKKIQKQGEYYYVGDKNKIDYLKLRKQREIWAKEIWKRVPELVRLLKNIPSITHIYITGSLAMNNPVSQDDDIDVCVVCKNKTLWTTRFFVVVWSKLFGTYKGNKKNKHQIKFSKHNKRKKNLVRNAYCFNLWLEERSITMSQHRQNLRTAYEIMQVKLIFSRNGKNPLQEKNEWVKDFLANWKGKKKKRQKYNNPNSPLHFFIVLFMQFLNPFFYIFQRMYMNSKMTIEEVGIDRAFFHPKK